MMNEHNTWFTKIYISLYSSKGVDSGVNKRETDRLEIGVILNYSRNCYSLLVPCKGVSSRCNI